MGRRGADPDAVAVSFVKVVELQARAIPHYHTVIRLDGATSDAPDAPMAPPETTVTAIELAALAAAAAGQVRRRWRPGRAARGCWGSVSRLTPNH